MVIAKFEGQYEFLSNFYMADFMWRGYVFKSGEHAFQAAKAYAMNDAVITDMTRYIEYVQRCPTPADAKYSGRSVDLDVAQWDKIKVQYMREIIHAKFGQVPDLAGQLINTGASMLVEGNDWNDTFWGRCKQGDKFVGLNTLGVILMEERGYWLHSDFGDKK